MSKKKTRSAAVEKLMYIGPTIPGVAVRNTMYAPLPDSLRSAFMNHPYLQGLCVPVSALPAALAQIRSQTGGIYNLYSLALRDSQAIQKGAV